MLIGSNRTPYRWFANLFCRWDPEAKFLRLGRIVWARGKGPGTGKGYTAKLSLALRPKLLGFATGCHEWEATLLGLRVHYQRAYGGWIA